jgi:hypothetical protein
MYSRTKVVVAVVVLGLLAACQGNEVQMTQQQRTAAVGAAAGTGIALITGASFGQTVGAAMVGGAAGYLGGELMDDD